MTILELKQFLSVPKSIVITSHTNPDGDAIGSSLALAHYLRRRGHVVTCIVPTEMPDFLMWIPGAKDILIYEYSENRPRADKAIAEAQLVFALDYNSLIRIDHLATPIMANTNLLVAMIDHHLHPDPFDFMLSDTSASSTCELIYDFFEMLGVLDEALSVREVRDAMYVGILTDTGSFSYATSPKLFRHVARLAEAGVDNADIQDKLFNSYSEKRLRLLGYCLDKMELFPEYKTGIIAVSFDEHAKFSIQRGDMEGVVNYILRIKGYKWAVLISERRNEVKLSMRSKGDFSVQEICSKHFNGGGHKNASGGSSAIGFLPTIQKVRELIPAYAEQLRAD